MILYLQNSEPKGNEMEAQTHIRQDKHYYAISELLEMGYSYYKIKRLVSDGCLIKLNNKMYENASYEGEESDFAIVQAYAPKGVVCMLSAARHYGLTNYLPDSVNIAIDRDMKISTLPDWPQVNVWYFSRKRYEVGRTEDEDEACRFPIYDIEKTVVDILYYRNKVGIEETNEVLKRYLSMKNRDMAKLGRYADSLGCRKILSTYLEVLL